MRHKTVSLLFLSILSVPLVGMWLGLDPFSSQENRNLAKLPKLSISPASVGPFIIGCNQYFNDNFGFRNILIRANYFLRARILGTSPSRQVVLGKDGWLFYSGDGEMEDYRGITRYDEKNLAKWAATLEIKRKWLAERGIRYLFVVAPNKSTIYGEMLPDRMNRIGDRTALDDFIEYMRRETTVEVVDLRPSLSAAKPAERLYHKTDTHWNRYGALLAYQQIMKPVSRWFPHLQAMELDDFRMIKKMGGGGDLAFMVGGSEFQKEQYIFLSPLQKNRASSTADVSDATKTPVTVQLPDPYLPRALVFHDSFFGTIAPYLAEHFHYSRYYSQVWNSAVDIDAIIKTAKPDIVIEEIVERSIKSRLPVFVDDTPAYLLPQMFNGGVSITTIADIIKSDRISVNDQLSIKAEGNHLDLLVKGQDPQLLLPPVQKNGADFYILKISITSNVVTPVQVFFKATTSQDYSEKNSIVREVKVGKNFIYIPIRSQIVGQLRIDPSTTAGHFTIEELELRSIRL